MADFDDIIQEINENIPDNNTQSITAKKLRDTLVDLTDAIETQQSEFEDGIQTQQSDFETNITNRQEAFENDVDEQLSSINTQFATGQNIGDVGIDDEPTAGSENLVKSGGVAELIDTTHLANPTDKSLAKAEDVIQLKAKLDGVTASETRVQLVTSGNGQNIYDGCYVNGITGRYQSSGSNKIIIVPVSGINSVRVLLGVIKSGSAVNTGYSFGVLTSGSKPDSTLSNFEPKVFSVFDKYGNEDFAKEYKLTVPEGVTWLCLSYRTVYYSNKPFYCYTLNGDTAIIDADIDRHYEKTLNVESTDIISSYRVESCIIDAQSGNWSLGSSGKAVHTKINIEGVKKFEAKGTAGGAGFAFLPENNEPVTGEYSGAILLSNGTYRHNLSANEVVKITPPANAKYLIVMRGASDNLSTPIYLKFSYKQQIVGTLNDVDIPIELHAGRLSATTGLTQEITGTTDGAINIMLRNYAFEKLIAFNPLYEQIVSVGYDESGTITYHCFAENGSAYLGATTYKDVMPVGTTHIRIGMAFSENQSDRNKYITLHCRLKEKNYNLLKSGTKEYSSKNFGNYCRFFSYEVTKPHIFDADSENTIGYYADGVDSNGNLQRDYTQGFFIPAKDYSNIGRPSKVVINCHGTTTFNFNKSSDPLAANLFLSKCGYCVIDCCTDTFYTNRTFNSGDVARASNYPTGNAWECYNELVKFVLDNFNVDSNAFYIAGKSAGGMNAISFANKFSNIKINAIGLMAPGIDVWMNMRVMYASGNNDFLAKIGCDNPQTTLGLGGVGGVGSAATAQKTYVLQYKALINLHNPLMTHISENFDKDLWVNELLDKGMFASRETGDTTPLDTNSELIAMVDESSIYMKSPLKIWHAIDDASVPYTESKWFVQMCKNGGCYAILRTWPSGNGRHYFDSFVEHEDGGGSTYIPQLVSYTTKFNEVVQANPAYCELVDWFNRW